MDCFPLYGVAWSVLAGRLFYDAHRFLRQSIYSSSFAFCLPIFRLGSFLAGPKLDSVTVGERLRWRHEYCAEAGKVSAAQLWDVNAQGLTNTIRACLRVTDFCCDAGGQARRIGCWYCAFISERAPWEFHSLRVAFTRYASSSHGRLSFPILGSTLSFSCLSHFRQLRGL